MDSAAVLPDAAADHRHSRLVTAVPVQLANFSVVPAHLRLLLVNVVSLGWNTYLSAANSATAQADTVEAKVDTAKALVPQEIE